MFELTSQVELYAFDFLDLDLGLSTGGQDIMIFGKTISSRYVSISGELFFPEVAKIIKIGSRMDIGSQTYQSHHLKHRIGLAIQQKLHNNFLIKNVRVVDACLRDQLSN